MASLLDRFVLHAMDGLMGVTDTKPGMVGTFVTSGHVVGTRTFLGTRSHEILLANPQVIACKQVEHFEHVFAFVSNLNLLLESDVKTWM